MNDQGPGGDSGLEKGETKVDFSGHNNHMKNKLPLAVFVSVLGLLGAGCLEDNPNRAVQTGKEDKGFLLLDGGGPMVQPDQGAQPQLDGPTQPPRLDMGGSTGKTTRGRFCHNVKAQGGKNVAIKLTMGSASMTANTDGCSSCVSIPSGQQTLRVYSGSQYLGGAYTTVKEQFEYVYLLTIPKGSKYAKLSKEELDPKKGGTCAGYKPKF